MNRENIFEERKIHYQSQVSGLQKKSNTFSTLRVVLFVLTAVAIVYFANAGSRIGVISLAVGFPLIFGLLVNRHNDILRQLNFCKNIVAINEEELKRLNFQLHNFPEGKAFEQNKHSYAKDMDVFGRNSLFQLLNRTTTSFGSEQLAKWLLERADKQSILDRQEAVAELAREVEVIQEIQAVGRVDGLENAETSSLIGWLKSPNSIKNQTKTLLLAYFLPTALLTLIALTIFTGISIYFAVLVGVINGFVLRMYGFKLSHLTENLSKSAHTLQAFSQQIQLIERKEVKAPYLQSLKSQFIEEQHKASQSIGKLKTLVTYLNARANWFYGLFDLVFLLDLHLLRAIESWKARHQDAVINWIDAIARLEAINSLAGYAYANPDYSFPKIKEDPFALATADLGHPLIHSKERVTNDLQMNGQGSISMITGSNMSGKSTFLRTIGVNMILAYCGAPVCAKDFSVGQLHLFTSMRTEDNLKEHISSFYAELQRIKQLLLLLEKEEPVLFMLDEILKGTNSKDRHAGAEALVKQLSQKNAMGFVSTHDLALGQLEKELTNLTNYSFNSEIIGDKIKFRYKLEAGICHSFNASKLMEQIGIQMKLGEPKND